MLTFYTNMTHVLITAVLLTYQIQLKLTRINNYNRRRCIENVGPLLSKSGTNTLLNTLGGGDMIYHRWYSSYCRHPYLPYTQFTVIYRFPAAFVNVAINTGTLVIYWNS